MEKSFLWNPIYLPLCGKNPLCGKIPFIKSSLHSFVWKNHLCGKVHYKVQFSFLGKIPCAEKSFFYKIQFTFPCFNGRQESGDSGESFSFGAEISFFFSFGADQFFSSIFLSGISKVETNCFGQHSPSNPRCRRSAAVQRPLWPTTW